MSWFDRLLARFGLIRMSVRDKYLYDALDHSVDRLKRVHKMTYDIHYNLMDRIAATEVHDSRVPVFVEMSRNMHRIMEASRWPN